MFYLCFVLTLVCSSSIAAQGGRPSYRKDYTYDRTTDAYYKLHTERQSYSHAERSCAAENAAIMPVTPENAQVAHGMMKQFPFIGNNVWVASDIVPSNTDKIANEYIEPDDYNYNDYNEESDTRSMQTPCNVITRDGDHKDEICILHLPFFCRVAAKEVKYDSQCKVFSNDYEYIPSVGSCYRISKQALAWAEAREECEQEGAHLAVFNSKAEADAVKTFNSQHSYYTKGAHHSSYVLIGFSNKRISENDFRTIFNQTLAEAGFNEWSPGEPNNLYNNEHCGSIWRDDGLLNDIACNHNFAFLCESEVNGERHLT